MELSSITPGPEALRALSHPLRLRILGLLRMDGPSTATALATRLGLNSGATSYHLRQLAQHGFVVDDEARGNARERWWRAAHQSTRVPTDDAAPDAVADRDTNDAFLANLVPWWRAERPVSSPTFRRRSSRSTARCAPTAST